MQEDKEAAFDAVDTVKASLAVFKGMFETITFKPENMRRAAQKGFLNATDAADYLVKKGVSFRTAHEIIGRLVVYAGKKNKTLEELTPDEYKNVSEFFGEDVLKAIDIATCAEARAQEGAPGKAAEAVRQNRAFSKEARRSLKR